MNRRSSKLRESTCQSSKILNHKRVKVRKVAKTIRFNFNRSSKNIACKSLKCNSNGPWKKDLSANKFNNQAETSRWNMKARSKDCKCKSNLFHKNTRWNLSHINLRLLKLINLTRFKLVNLKIKDKMRSRSIKLKWKNFKPNWLSFILCLNLSRAFSFRENNTLRNKERFSMSKLKNCSLSMLI